ncbi:MAG: GNAT family N-acetyltransferase [Myxococcales bacterium]|nr:GNAT family N-acetyltransferase [Myxococcales bacterium]
MNDIFVRPVRDDEQPLLRRFLLIAARIEGTDEPAERVDTYPDLARYHHGWPREGDFGFVACAGAAREPVACAWGRLFRREAMGYGLAADDGSAASELVSESLPELAMGTLAEFRGRGIGERLLRRWLAAARERFAGASLSVRRDNPAARLYRRVGFVEVEGSEHLNRVGTASVTMVMRWADNEARS